MARPTLRPKDLAAALLAAALGLLATGPVQANPAAVTLPVPAVTLYPGDVIADVHLVDRAFRVAGRVAVDNRLALVGKVDLVIIGGYDGAQPGE